MPSRRVALAAAGVLSTLALAGVLGLRSSRSAETNAAQRGEEVARKAGCFACHGPGGNGGIANPGSPSGKVPDWSGRTLAVYAKSDQELRDWILLGSPRRRPAAEGGAIPMPAYQDVLDAAQVDDLAAYLRAAAGPVSVPDDAYEGRQLASALGCFGCHGPSGIGGLANPGSFKGRISPWTGGEFDALVRDDQELRAWILDGRIRRLWDNALARRFLDRQRVQMPAYRGRLSEAELDRLVAYIRWQRGA